MLGHSAITTFCIILECSSVGYIVTIFICENVKVCKDTENCCEIVVCDKKVLIVKKN